MTRLVPTLLSVVLAALPVAGQQPAGVFDAVANLADQPGSRISFSLDRSELQQASQLFGPGSPSSLTAVQVDTFHFQQPAFYAPEPFGALVEDYNAAGWKHLVNAHASAAGSAQPTAVLTDLWLHFEGTEIRDVSVLLRAPRQMTLVAVSGVIRPLDLLHLSGHFGLPKVDPDAVMVPAPPGR